MTKEKPSPVNNVNFMYYSICGGILSAFGSLLGKLSGLFDSWLVAACCFIVMVVINSAGFMLFAKSLNASSSSLQPVLLSSASTYSTSALLGALVFSERTTLLWWTGTFFVLTGILIMSVGKEKAKKE